MKASKSAGSRLIIARFDYQATEAHELSVSRGERLILLDGTREWWLVQNSSNQIGYVPSNYVKRERQNLLTSIRSAFRDVLRRRDKDGMSRSFGSEARYPVSSRSGGGRQQLTPTRSDPNLNAINAPRSGATLSSTSFHGATLSRMDPRYASFSAPRPQPAVAQPAKRTVSGTDGPHRQPMKAYECESYSSGAFETVPTAQSAVRFASVLYTYVAQRFDELTLRRGDRVGVYEVCVDGWWRVQYVGAQGETQSKMPLLTRIGWFPSNYLELESQSQSQLDKTAPSTDSLDAAEHESRFSTGNPLCSSLLEAVTPDDSVARTEPDTDAFRPVSGFSRLSADKNITNLTPAPEPDVRDSVTPASSQPCQTVEYSTEANEPQVSNKTDPTIVSERKQIRSSGDCASDGHAGADWYWAAARRVDCERALATATGGTFLVRDCESSPGDFTIVVRRDEQAVQRERLAQASLCRNFRVHFVPVGGSSSSSSPHSSSSPSGLFAIGTLKFLSLDALLSHYQRHPIFSNANETLFLVAPLRRDRPADELDGRRKSPPSDCNDVEMSRATSTKCRAPTSDTPTSETEQIYDSAFSSAMRFRDSIPRFNTESNDDSTL